MPESSNSDIKKGGIIIATSGDYSSYTLDSVWQALQDFNLQDQIQIYPGPVKCGGYGFQKAQIKFLHWLEHTQKLIAEVNYYEFDEDDIKVREIRDAQ